ncbi:MAG: hypothetical protein ACO1OQ_08060 [Rufibacter sp.]
MEDGESVISFASVFGLFLKIQAENRRFWSWLPPRRKPVLTGRFSRWSCFSIFILLFPETFPEGRNILLLYLVATLSFEIWLVVAAKFLFLS